MTDTDPTTVEGTSFAFSAEAEPIGDRDEPCVWCNHDSIIPQRKAAIADGTDRDPSDVPYREALCLADYVFVFGERAEVPVCEGCLYDLPVEYGDSTTRDLPYAWQDEVVLKTEVPRLDADTGHVHRGVPVAALADLSFNIPPTDG